MTGAGLTRPHSHCLELNTRLIYRSLALGIGARGVSGTFSSSLHTSLPHEPPLLSELRHLPSLVEIQLVCKAWYKEAGRISLVFNCRPQCFGINPLIVSIHVVHAS